MGIEPVDRRVRKTRRQLREMSYNIAQGEKGPGYHGSGADRHGGLKPGHLLSPL